MSALNQLLAYSSGEWAWRVRNISRYWGASVVSGDGSVIYAIAGNLLYITYDRGLTWSTKTAVSGTTRLLTSQNGQIIYADTSTSVYVSYDYGSTWTATSIPYRWVDPQSVSVYRYGDIVYSANSTGVRKSYDYGMTNSVILSGSWDAVFCNTTGYDVYALSRTAQMKRSRDGGNTWETVNNGLAVGFNILRASDDGTVILAIAGEANTASVRGPYVSLNSGLTWRKLPGYNYTSIFYDGCAISTDGRIMALIIKVEVNEVVLVSRDYGTTWSQDLTPWGSEMGWLSSSYNGEIMVMTNEDHVSGAGAGSKSTTSLYIGSEEE